MPALFQKIFKTGLVTEPLAPDDAEIIQLVHQVDEKTKRLLGRALAIREVDAGSCNGCEVEITALGSPVYDSERFGIHFVASPRHPRSGRGLVQRLRSRNHRAGQPRLRQRTLRDSLRRFAAPRGYAVGDGTRDSQHENSAPQNLRSHARPQTGRRRWRLRQNLRRVQRQLRRGWQRRRYFACGCLRPWLSARTRRHPARNFGGAGQNAEKIR